MYYGALVPITRESASRTVAADRASDPRPLVLVPLGRTSDAEHAPLHPQNRSSALAMRTRSTSQKLRVAIYKMCNLHTQRLHGGIQSQVRSLVH